MLFVWDGEGMNKLKNRIGLEEENPMEVIYERPTACEFKKIAKKYQSIDLARMVCSHDGKALQYVSKKIIDYELCIISVNENGLALKYVPERYVTPELCEEAVVNNGFSIKYVPEKFITLELCEKAVISNGRAIEYIPENMRTANICEKAVSYYLDIPDSKFFDNREEYIERVEKHISNSKQHGCKLWDDQNYPIYFVPDDLMDEVMLVKAIEYSPFSLRDIRNDKKTEELMELAVSINGLAIEYVPAKARRKALVSIALKNNPMAITYIYSGLVNKKESQELFERDYRVFPWLPEKYITLDMCMHILEIDRFSVEYLFPHEKIKRFGTEDVDLILFGDFPERIRNNKMVIDEIVSKERYGALPIIMWNENILRRQNDENDMSLLLDRRNEKVVPLFEQTVEYLKEKIRCEEDAISVLASTERYILDRDKIGSLLTFSQDNSLKNVKNGNISVHDLVKDDDSEYVYYISDIHIEYQIFEEALNRLKNKKIDISLLIDFKRIVCDILIEKVEELINGKQGLLLIGGDVSDSIELAEMFYKMLSHRWRGKIVSILGNHELWDGRSINKDEKHSRKVEEVIDDYKKICVNLCNVKILENELLIKYKGEKECVISEKDILECQDEELREIVNDSTLVILGGIGYTGLNDFYNAEAGVYSQTITTREEDRERAGMFYDIHEKLKRCAFDKQIIVLTHTPVNDWCKGICNKNWIYVNGHTHKNMMSKAKEKAVILADNQVGYIPRKWDLKAFRIRKLWYDPFEMYADGVYVISSDEYKDFNRGRGIKSNGCNYDGKLYALKRQGLYMFILETNKSLCLMAGGVRKKLEGHDVRYYYDNMLDYKQCVLDVVAPYRNIMEQISGEIRKFGGVGTIHGCIIDISWFSHVYINPYDGKISVYWAINKMEREVYPSIKSLIDNREPQFKRDFRIEYDKHSLPIIETKIVKKNSKIKSAIIPKWVYGTEIYEPSRIMKSVQYVWEQNVIRIWNDSVLERATNKSKKITTKKESLR